jgi:predicted ATPase
MEVPTYTRFAVVPATLHASLMARLDRLGSVVREVAHDAAAIGREFDYALLASITDLSEVQLCDALDQLVSAGLVFVRGIRPEASYLFKHALVQDAAYGSLLRRRRQRLHSQIVTALEDRFPAIAKTQPARLAQHCTEAGLLENAAGYWLKAGQQALVRSAMAEAAVQLQMGLDLLANLLDNQSRQQLKLDMRFALTSALIATKGWEAVEVIDSFAQANTLAEQTEKAELVQLSQCNFHFARAEYKLALSIAEQLHQLSKAQNNITLQLASRATRGVINLFLGEFATARVSAQPGRTTVSPCSTARMA